MNKETFLSKLTEESEHYNKILETDKGDWIVKGFIDSYKKIYTISIDTKVVSKVIEILLTPMFEEFANKNNLTLETQEKQNHYPDLTFISNESREKFAVDIKTTIRKTKDKINSMTLGTYQGYFQNRSEKDCISYPYDDYSAHIVFGVLYSRREENPNEKQIFSLDELENIPSVIKAFQFFVQEKYKVASATKGSGNTRNIGSVTNVDDLIRGNGVFSEFGEEVFDDYWMHYIDQSRADELGQSRPYKNIKTYFTYKDSIKEIEEEKKQKAIIKEQSESDE